MNKSYSSEDVSTSIGKLHLRLVTFSAILLLIFGSIFSWIQLQRFEKELKPQIHNKATILSKSITTLIAKALNSGYPLEKMHGLEPYFTEILEEHPEVVSISAVDLSSDSYRLLSSVGAVSNSLKSSIANHQTGSEPIVLLEDSESFSSLSLIRQNEKVVAAVSVAMDRSIITDTVKESVVDILVIFLVSLLIVMEIVIFLSYKVVTVPLMSVRHLLLKITEGNFTSYLPGNGSLKRSPLVKRVNHFIERINELFYSKERTISPSEKYQFAPKGSRFVELYRSAVGVRLPLFLIIFSESLSISFLPVWVKSFYKPIGSLSEDVVLGLPISVFMLFWAISLVWGGGFSERKGRTITYRIGAAVTAIGLLATAFSNSMGMLLACRAITAVGYGMVYITCQGYVLDTTNSENRTQGIAMFLSGFFAGSLSGAAIGGILADRLGYQYTFIFAAVMGTIGVLFASQLLIENPQKNSGPSPKLKLKDLKLRLSNSKLITVVFLSAIPAKICLTGFLYYTVPLLLRSLGTSQSFIGRGIMMYGISMIILSPVMAKIADRSGKSINFIAFCGILSGIGLISVKFFYSPLGILIAIGILGVAHSVGVSSQLTLITEVCEKEREQIGISTITALFRLLERIGNISGPIIAGTLVAFLGFSDAILAIGIITISCAILFWKGIHHVSKKV